MKRAPVQSPPHQSPVLYCPGCGNQAFGIRMIGVYVQPPFSRAIIYPLCPRCASVHTGHERIAIAEAAEARIASNPARYGVCFGRVRGFIARPPRNAA